MEGRHLARGAAWSLASRAASQVVQFGASVALARLLGPEAFGLVAMAVTATALAGMIAEAGISTAVVQRRELSDEQVRGAFVLTAGLGALLAAAVFAAAPAIARFYGAAPLVGVCRVGAGGVFLGAVAAVPRALLVRRLEVARVAAIDFAAVALSSIVSVTLAMAGAGVWALAVAGPVGALATSCLSLLAVGSTPRGRATLGAVRPLLGVGLHLLGFTFVNYWARTLDNVLVGVWLGEKELGFYARAYALMLLPVTEITGVLSSTMLPALSRVQGDHAATRAAYLRVLSLVAFVALPAMIGLSLVAEPFVAVVFGPAWAPVAPILRILAIVGAVQSLVNPVGWLYQSQGRTDRMFRWGIFASSLIVAALAAGAWRGSGVRVAAAYLAVNLLLLVPAYRYVGALVGLRLAEVCAAALPAVRATAVMAVAVAALDAAVARSLGHAPRLAVDVALGVLVYAAAGRWLRVPASRDAADLVLQLRPSWTRWIDPVLALVATPGKDSERAR